MRDQIIEASIRSLRQEGLRFSVDTLAETLKISKKTVYKYFPTKEALADAMYGRYYDTLLARVEQVAAEGGEDRNGRLLLCCCDSAGMVRGEIFNKYRLNRTVGARALERHEAVWRRVLELLFAGRPEEAALFRLVAEGAFDRAIGAGADPERVVGMVVKLV